MRREDTNLFKPNHTEHYLGGKHMAEQETKKHSTTMVLLGLRKIRLLEADDFNQLVECFAKGTDNESFKKLLKITTCYPAMPM